jgi:hypothetical protein
LLILTGNLETTPFRTEPNGRDPMSIVSHLVPKPALRENQLQP